MLIGNIDKSLTIQIFDKEIAVGAPILADPLWARLVFIDSNKGPGMEPSPALVEY